jgi:hypothetical protein
LFGVRTATAVTGILFGLALSSAAHAAPEAPTYGCSPPAIATAASCAAWHTGPVTLKWQWDNFGSTPDNTGGNSCDNQKFTDDTAGTSVTCRVVSDFDMTASQTTVTVHIDQTPPNVTGLTPSRPADFNGWWNHPVRFTFAGSDATSGLAVCDPVTFSGPGTVVAGTCRDNAGNAGSRSFPAQYDATPPSLTRVRATPGNGDAALSWITSSDVVRVEVRRSPGDAGATSSVVYAGAGKSLVDAGLNNGTRYRYTITAFDQADNAATAARSARPQAWNGLQPAHGARLKRLPMLRWPKVNGATYYNVQLYRGKQKVFTTWPKGTQVSLRRHVRFNGHDVTLGRGRYRWYVWPGLGKRSEHRYGDLAGQSTFVIVP